MLYYICLQYIRCTEKKNFVFIHNVVLVYNGKKKLRESTFLPLCTKTHSHIKNMHRFKILCNYYELS